MDWRTFSPYGFHQGYNKVSGRGRGFILGISLLMQGAVLPFILSERAGMAPFFLWVASLGGILFSLYFFPSRFPSRRITHLRNPSSTSVLALFILLLAVFMRLYRLGVIPPGLWVDEIYTASNAMELNANGYWKNPFRMTPLVGEGWVETSNLYLYFVRGLWLIFGRNYWGVKMASVLPGIAAVWLIFLLGRRLWGNGAALAASFFLAVSSWQITLSRWGWDEVLLTALQLPAFLFLWRGIQKRKNFYFALGGIFLGLCLYTYASSRLIVLFVFFFLTAECVFNRGFFQRTRSKLMVFLMLFLLTSLPLAIYFTEHPSAFSSRLSEVSIMREVRERGSLTPLWRNLISHLGMFHATSDPNIRHHIAGAALLDRVSGLFMLLGLILTLSRMGRQRNRFLLLWMGFGLLGGILSRGAEAPQSYRAGVAAPAVFLLCGIGFAGAGRFVMARLRSVRVRRMATLAGISLLSICFGLNFRRYFILYPNDPSLWRQFWGAEHTFQARLLKARQKAGAQVYLDAAFGSNYYFPYAVAREIIMGKSLPIFDPLEPMKTEQKGGLEIYIPPFRRTVYMRLFPEAHVSPYITPTGDETFISVPVTGEMLTRLSSQPQPVFKPVNAAYYTDSVRLFEDSLATLELKSPSEKVTRMAARSYLCLPADYYATFKLEGATSATLAIDGGIVLRAVDGERVVVLKKGVHPLEICADVRYGSVIRLLWRPDFEHLEPVPSSFLLPRELLPQFSLRSHFSEVGSGSIPP